MANENPANELPQTPSLPKPPRAMRRGLAIVLGCALLFAGGYAFVRYNRSDSDAGGGNEEPNVAPKLFVGWAKPDFALIITGQTFGYLQPCGCSHPQYGGLARRWEFINSLKQKGWTLVPIDVGDIYPNQKGLDTPLEQTKLKFETAMRALHVMGYHAIGLGKVELTAGLNSVLPQYSLNNPRPRPLAANLIGVEPDGIFHAMNVRPYEIIEVQGAPKIGVTNAIAKSLQDALANDATLKFDPKQMVAALAVLKQQAEFNVVLFQTEEKTPLPAGQESEITRCVKWCAPQASVNVLIHSTEESEPPFLPTVQGDTQVINVGHKGKYVGVLGVWKKNDKYEYKYQPVLIGPEYQPKPGNPVAKLMEDYAKRAKADNLIAKYLQTPHRTQAILRGKKIEAKYVGSEMCGNCHEHAYAVWNKVTDTGHSHSKAHDTLVNAENPGLRQFDGECMQCHTTGFKHDTGYNDPLVRNNPRLQQKLLDVGCESCHGPGSAHANNPKNEEFRKLLNPWAKHFNKDVPDHVRMQRIDNFCQTCHDIENDVHWDFKTKWPKVEHMNPPAKGAKKK